MTNRSFLRTFTAVLAASLLTACTQNLTETFGSGIAMSPSEPATNAQGLPQTVEPAFAQFQDIPIPNGAKMNMDRTLILGENDSWIGRLVIDSQSPQASLFDFFKNRTSQFGWQEITSVRSATSVLAYSKDNRVMTVQIQSQPIIGTQVDITMSPKGSPAPVKPVTNAAFPDDTLSPGDKTMINPASLRPVEIR
jgi:hypothetical protein